MAGNIDRRVRTVIARIIRADFVVLEQSLRDDLELNGRDRRDIATTLNGEFDIDIGEGSLLSWQTVADIVRAVESRLVKQRAAA